MNIIEAIRSGLPFRRKFRGNDGWIRNDQGVFYGARIFSQAEILSDDWETQKASMPITASQFWEAAAEAFSFKRTGLEFGASMLHFTGKAPPHAELTLLARRLGLEPK